MEGDETLAGNGVFPATRWTQVAAASGPADTAAGEALELLCRHYWQPVYAVARRAGNDVEDAKDLTQGFFAKLLEKGWLGTADQEKGRFRTFLVTALKRYMMNEWHREHAAKRGGMSERVPLDAQLAERIDAGESGMNSSPEALFDRRWALALLDVAMKRLEEESADSYAVLKDCLTAERGGIDYEKVASSLKLSEGAARVAVHRFRKRYRVLIREEVARTVADEDEVDDEMRALFLALG
ncbi:RNA polymerase sigma factor [Haloferula sp.]|uniref:RNA polymerase sigma factor n=1 Tax=Haloferula sp. TaxID=2497595 RepID=UPI00329F0C2B